MDLGMLRLVQPETTRCAAHSSSMNFLMGVADISSKRFVASRSCFSRSQQFNRIHDVGAAAVGLRD